MGYLLIGFLLVAVALLASMVKRLPATETMIYLAAGVGLGPLGLGFFSIGAVQSASMLEWLAEIGVIVSLFTAGLKLRVPLRDPKWWIPFRLAFVSMTLTVGMLTAIGVFGLGLPLGVAVILGAVLAPTDPVLASEVQLAHPHERSRLRFSITGEAGLNDGTAFPFVMLGLGLVGLHEIGPWGWRWWAVDVVWAIVGGLAIGAVSGAVLAKVVLRIRRKHRETLVRDEFLALGLIAFAYGAALMASTYGFLAVFAAGLALRLVEHQQTGDAPPADVLALEEAAREKEIAARPERAPAYMAGAVLHFNEQVERILEVALVLVLGAALAPAYFRFEGIWLIALLFFVVRPVAVLAGLLGQKMPGVERVLISWFGIRGIGSIYYLMYAVNHGLGDDEALRLVALTLTTVAASIVLHGSTVTPFMAWHRRRTS